MNLTRSFTQSEEKEMRANPAIALAFLNELLDRAALNVGSIVIGKLFGDDKEVQLRCAVADLAVREGVGNDPTPQNE